MTFSRPGAIDLSALASPTPSTSTGAPAGGQLRYAIDVTEQSFQNDALEASLNHVVVVSLWSPRSPQSVSFNEVLIDTAAAFDGAIQIALIDVDSNPSIAQAFGTQAVPVVVGLIKGQAVPLFQGTVDAAQVRQYFDELLRVAAQNGLVGRAQATESETVVESDEEPADDPRFSAADEAFAAGDFPTAIAEYEKLQLQHPADEEVAERLAGVKLLSRTTAADLFAARQAAADNPADVDAQLLAADFDISGGHVDDAFDRIISLIRVSFGDDRDRLRERLLELFVVVGTTDPRVARARRALATALF